MPCRQKPEAMGGHLVCFPVPREYSFVLPALWLKTVVSYIFALLFLFATWGNSELSYLFMAKMDVQKHLKIYYEKIFKLLTFFPVIFSQIYKLGEF